MTLGELLFLAIVVMVAMLALFFIVCRKYEEGVVGNLFLGLLIIACGVIVLDAFRGKLELPAPHYYMLIVGMAVFMLRHAWRFAMFHWHGYFGWKRPADMPQPQDAGR